jgi:hypothetical protein
MQEVYKDEEQSRGNKLKGKCHAIFYFRFFSRISFPKPLSIPLYSRAVSKYSKKILNNRNVIFRILGEDDY